LGKLKVVKNWDDSNWEWLQRFWNRQLEWVRLVTTGYPKWIRVEIGESFTAPQIYGHKLMEACWQTNRFSDKPKSAGWPMYSKNAKSTFLRRFFFWGGRPGKLRKQLPEHAMNYIHLQGFKASFQLPATVKYVYLSKSSIYNNIHVCIYIYTTVYNIRYNPQPNDSEIKPYPDAVGEDRWVDEEQFLLLGSLIECNWSYPSQAQ
jgi:hypothetical protein